jgi:hypothetical protein
MTLGLCTLLSLKKSSVHFKTTVAINKNQKVIFDHYRDIFSITG